MYHDELNRAHLYYVCRFSPGGDTDGDYRRHLAGMQAALAAGQADPESLTVMIMQDAGYPAPNANVRQAVAEITGAPSFKGAVAVVTTNPLLRGVITALDWLRPRRYREGIFADTGAGLAWLEEICGGPLAPMRSAVDRLAAAASVGNRRPAAS